MEQDISSFVTYCGKFVALLEVRDLGFSWRPWVSAAKVNKAMSSRIRKEKARRLRVRSAAICFIID